jgi:hypothetical protein
LNRFAQFIRVAAMLPVVAACVPSRSSGNPPHAHGEPAAEPAPGGAVMDASYDWHVLIIAPFGMLLKDSPIALHEVLLFHDDARSGADADDKRSGGDADGKDCYAIGGTPPRFVGRLPDQYLLCFDHDRLNRIEASVRLPADEAQRLFAQACALWLKNTLPIGAGATTQAGTITGAGTTCEGSDGVAFSARLALVSGEATATLSMTLLDAAAQETGDRSAGHDAVHDAPRDK